MGPFPKLTATVAKGGCAAKLPAGELRKFLGAMNLVRPPELAVGIDTLDDACLWDLGNGTYLVQTLDFFTPIVDDPRDFGRIAAANALSDVFAMGGQPKLALSILAFPTATLPMEMLEPLMAGAVEVIHAAGAALVGGHSIDDETLKLGFCVTGFVEHARAWTNAKAQPGDVLILTKALGTGAVTSALKSGKAEPQWVEAAVASMIQLNDTAGLLNGVSVHAATDVTGFGLFGHALQMAQASKVTIEIALASLPSLPGAKDCLEQGILNRAHRSNAAYVATHGGLELPSHLDAVQRWLPFDPQTSGGLLLSIPAAQAEVALVALRRRFAAATIVGKVKMAQDAGALLAV